MLKAFVINQAPAAVQSAFTVSPSAGTKKQSGPGKFMALLTISSIYRAILEPLFGTHKITRLVERPWFETLMLDIKWFIILDPSFLFHCISF